MSSLVVQPSEAEQARRLPDQQYLTFALRGEVFAMPIAQVREIIEYGQLTTVPMMPPHLRGVINLRGAVVPVIDLACRFWSETGTVGKRTCIVIMELRNEEELGTQVLGVIVDAVHAVLDIPAGEIEPAPSFGAQVRTDFIQGMAKVAGRFVVILQVNRVLSLSELASLQMTAALA